MEILTIVLFVLLQTSNLVLSQTTGDDVKTLLTNLYNGYDKRVRPVWNQDSQLEVAVQLHLHSINEINVQSQKMVVSGWFGVNWIDDFLVWERLNNGGIGEVYVDSKTIWLPTIALTNAYEGIARLDLIDSKATVDDKGNVYWYPGGKFTMKCAINIKYYPFDIQTCTMSLEIWDLRFHHVVLKANNDSVILDEFQRNGEWDLVATEYISSSTISGTSKLIINFKLFRRPKFVIYITVTPVVMLGFLNVCVFLIPLSSGEKNSYAVTIFLSYTVFLGTISSELPHTSIQTPYLTIYLISLLALSVLILLITVIHVRIFLEHGYDPMPGSLLKIWSWFCKNSKRKTHPVKDDVSNAEFYDQDVMASTSDMEATLLKDILPKLDKPLFYLFLTILCLMSLTLALQIKVSNS